MPLSNIKLLENFAGYCAVKNKVISNNIANAGTENYKRLDVKFKDVLQENMSANLKTTEKGHFSGINTDSQAGYEVFEDPDKTDVSGVNNVDIDNEMAELAVNNLNYKFATKKITDYFKIMQGVIRGGGGL